MGNYNNTISEEKLKYLRLLSEQYPTTASVYREIEPKNPYYSFYKQEEYCIKILHEFGLDTSMSHIINGHTPIKVADGESPVKANNRLIVIDGGFCKAYQKTTGIAGYTLIYNSHGMRLKAHQPFESVEKVLTENKDIESSSNFFEKEPERVMVKDTDNGQIILETIKDLELLLSAYRQGIVKGFSNAPHKG